MKPPPRFLCNFCPYRSLLFKGWWTSTANRGSLTTGLGRLADKHQQSPEGARGFSCFKSARSNYWEELTMVDSAEMLESVDRRLMGGKEDRYGGFIVDNHSLPDTLDAFRDVLKNSLQHWRQNNMRAIWMKIPLEKARYIGPAVEEYHFVFHHAEETYVMLVNWLPGGEHNLPPSASHQVGIGAFVLNDNNELLAVQERRGPLTGMNVWKLPTGLANAGEDIADAAERELLEETAIQAKFQAIIAIRQGHGFLFGKSDMFFLCALKLVSNPQDLKVQESELVGAQWMPLSNFMDQDFIAKREVFSAMMRRCIAFSEGKYPGISGKRMGDSFRKKEEFIMWADGTCSSEEENIENTFKSGAKL